ncbi:MAG TPA: hypothetical protein VF495_01360 [Phenylobacterium sp.]
MTKLSAWLAVGVSIPLAVSQLVRNWDNMDRWWTWGVDELVAVLLAIAGVMVLRGRSSRFLAPAWSFATALYMSSLATHLFSLDHAPTAIQGTERLLTMIIGGLLAVSLAGAFMALSDRGPKA